MTGEPATDYKSVKLSDDGRCDVFHRIIHRPAEILSTDHEKYSRFMVQNLKYFLLDRGKNGCRMVTQSRLLTGIMTGPGRGERSGDVPVRERKSTETEAITP